MSGHLPANFFTEEIEIKDRVGIMLFKLKSVFVSTGRDSDVPERINISIKISPVILSLDSDKPDSDKNRKR